MASHTYTVEALYGYFAPVTDGATTAFVQLQGDGPVYLVVAALQPAPSEVGPMLIRDKLEEVEFTSIATGDKVWAVSTQDETNRIAVIADAAAPVIL